MFLELCQKTFLKIKWLTNDKFILHLKESEARFNHRDDDFVAKLFFEKRKTKKDVGLESFF